MKPVTYDFDVVTDTPKVAGQPKRRAPEAAEHAPHADAEEERRHTAPPDLGVSVKVQAAE